MSWKLTHLQERRTYPPASKHRGAQWPWWMTALVLFLVDVAIAIQAVGK